MDSNYTNDNRQVIRRLNLIIVLMTLGFLLDLVQRFVVNK